MLCLQNHRGRVTSQEVWVFWMVDTSHHPALGYMEIVPPPKPILSSISYWVVSCPKIDDQKPLLKGHPRLEKKTSFPNAVSSFALRTSRALPISHIAFLPSVPHIQYHTYISNINPCLPCYFLLLLLFFIYSPYTVFALCKPEAQERFFDWGVTV